MRMNVIVKFSSLSYGIFTFALVIAVIFMIVSIWESLKEQVIWRKFTADIYSKISRWGDFNVWKSFDGGSRLFY